MLTQATYTADEFAAMPDESAFELVNGQLLEKKMGSVSSWVGGESYWLLASFCKEHHLGWVFPADTGFQCFPDSPNTVRKPDVAFIRYGRLPDETLPVGYIRIVPDLVVEVISPNELAYEVDAKVDDFMGAGVRLIWVINPVARTVRIHRANGTIGLLREQDELDGEDVLPGFRCPVRELFPPAGSVAPQETTG
jgi:Uma2 family endonuclease